MFATRQCCLPSVIHPAPLWLSLLASGEICCHIFLNSSCNIAFFSCFVKLFASNMFVKFNVALAYAFCIFVSNFRHSLSWLVHKVVLYEPLAYEFL